MFFSILLSSGLTAPAAQELAKIYAPILVHDSRETSPLTSVEALLATGPRLEIHCDSGPSFSEPIFRFTESLLKQSNSPSCTTALDFHRANPAPVARGYYHILDQGLYLTIQYWFFYAWNETQHLGGGDLAALCGNHEGDWEHISLRIHRVPLSTAQNSDDYRNAIDALYFAQHKPNTHPERKYFKSTDRRLSFKNAQVYVFSARGSHASYPSPGTWPLFTLAGITLNDENDGKGLTLDLANDQLEPIMHAPWFGYPGHWGAIVDNICTPLEKVTALSNDGPFGPGHTGKVSSFYEGDWHDR